jgi:hypothetical protein
MGVIDSKDKKPKMPKTFLSPAYIKVLEKNLYGLFRNLEVEEKGQREKLREIGPIKLLRKAKLPDEDKQVVIRTVDPKTGEAIGLVEVS